MNTRPYWLIASVVTAMLAFVLSTVSPLGLMVLAGYGLAVLSLNKMARDSANIWGLRLLIYALGAALGRSAAGPFTHYDARAFLTVGMILGGEIVLQTLREPPRGLRFDPAIILLSGLLFLISCNTSRPHIFALAPVYVFTLVMAMNETRPGARTSRFAQWTRFGIVAIAVVVGAGVHSVLWSNRSQIMRLGGQLLSGSNYQSGAGDADMGDNPELSTNFAQGASTARLLKVTGRLDEPHLRGAAFDLYQGGAWGPKLSVRAIGPALPSQTNETVDGTEGGDLRTDASMNITLLRPSGQVLYAPLNALALVPLNGQSFDWDRYAGPLKTSEETVPLSYGIVGAPGVAEGTQIAQGPLCVAPDAEQRARLLKVPTEIDPRVSQLARDITRDATGQAAKIEAIGQYLINHHGYSLTFAREEGDPVSEFLLSDKSAHCQYFAAGAVMLMRASGVPARYVTGFYAHEKASDGGFIVRGRDAHAWAEAYVDGVGWVNVDATPADGRADPDANPLPWYQRTLEQLTDGFGRVRAWFGRLTTAQILALMAIVMVIWGAERYRQSWSRQRGAARGAQIPPDLAPLAGRFERALQKRGITLAPGVPWSESLPPDWEREARWVALYNRLRFARAADADGDANGEVRQLAAELDALEKSKIRADER